MNPHIQILITHTLIYSFHHYSRCSSRKLDLQHTHLTHRHLSCSFILSATQNLQFQKKNLVCVLSLKVSLWVSQESSLFQVKISFSYEKNVLEHSSNGEWEMEEKLETLFTAQLSRSIFFYCDDFIFIKKISWCCAELGLKCNNKIYLKSW